MRSYIGGPRPAIDLKDTEPRALLELNAPLGYFASQPRYLAIHLALAASPDTRSAVDLADQLVAAAKPKISLSEYYTERLRYRLGLALRTSEPQYTTGICKEERRRSIELNENGRLVVPLAALLAARWLLARETTTAILPPPVKGRHRQGTRMAYLQHCLTAATTEAIAADLAIAPKTALENLTRLKQAGLVTHTRGFRHTFAVSTDTKPAVVYMVSALHSLNKPSYTDALRTRAAIIVDAPHYYGVLAHAAVTQFLAAPAKPKANGV